MRTSTLGTTLMITLLGLSAGSVAYAGTDDGNAAAAASYSTSAGYSTSAIAEPQEPATPNKPPAPEKVTVVSSAKPAKVSKPARTGVRPFTHPAIAVKGGIVGAGFDVALPLARKFNIRGGANFFNFADTFSADGTDYHANLKFQSSNVSIDWFPFGNAFRMSAIGQVYNGNGITANTSVPTNQSFELGSDVYYQFANGTNPVLGSAVFTMGNQGGSKMAPGFSIGWGNMIPRGKGQHWSMPFEMGFVYIQAPQMQLNLKGMACMNQGDADANGGPTCVDLGSNAEAQQNIVQEQVDINNTLSGLRFFPVLSVGLSYKF